MHSQPNPYRRFLLSSAAPLAALLLLSASARPQDDSGHPTAREHFPAHMRAPRTPFEREVLGSGSATPRTRPERTLPAALPAPVITDSGRNEARAACSPPTLDRDHLAPLDEVHFTPLEQGEVWAQARTYKASFSEDGATYIPFLGSSAPRNFPLSMRVVSAQVGPRSLGLRPARVERAGDRVVIDRGPVRAEYVLGLEAVEQLFVLDQPADQPGDLVLQLAIETELEPRSAGAGWTFDGPRGGVQYGEVVALDAQGRRLAMPASVSQTGIEFVVPAAFLASASYPVAIDPVISTSTIDDSFRDQLTPDIAWDPVLDRFTVVFDEVFSASDHDVKVVQTNVAGTVVDILYADASGVDVREPHVAIHQFGRRALLVYTTGPTGDRDIQGNLITLLASPLLSPRMLISDNPEGLDLASPDVGGDAFGATMDAYFTIVWQRIWNDLDADIVIRQMTPFGTLLVEDLVTNFVDVRDEAPDLSNCIPPGQTRHNVVWRRERDTGPSVMGAQYLFNGFPITPEFEISSNSLGHTVSDPSVSAVGPLVPGETLPTYAVALSVFYSSTLDADVEIYVFAGDQLVTSAVDARVEHTELFDDQLRPSVATGGISFALAYEGAPTSFSPHLSYITSFTMANRQIAVRERRVIADSGSGDHFFPRICSTWEHGDGAPNFGPYGTVSQLTTASGSDIVFGRYQSDRASGAQFQACYGNPNSTGERSLLTIDGYAGDTTGARTVHVDGLPAGKPGLFFASQTTFSFGVIPSGSSGRLCLRNPTGRFPGIVNTGPAGHAELALDVTALPLQGNHYPAIAGTTWYFQFWHRDTVSGVPTSNFSNAAGIPFH